MYSLLKKRQKNIFLQKTWFLQGKNLKRSTNFHYFLIVKDLLKKTQPSFESFF